MNKVEKKDFDNYLKEARTWETDKVQEIMNSRKTAWRVAAASGAVAFASVMAIAMLMPLKKVEPFVIRVDNSTGIVDVVQTIKDGKTNYDEAINKYFTQWYVRYREGYSKDLAEDYYANVGLMSSSLEQQKYFQIFNPKNPQSPLNVYGDFAKVKIAIKSTSFISPNVALVRYTKALERGMDKPNITHWAATISFKYSPAPMSENDRGVNPLGFQVTEYRNDPDAPGSDLSAPASMNTAPAQAPVSYGVTAFPGESAMPQTSINSVPRVQVAP